MDARKRGARTKPTSETREDESSKVTVGTQHKKDVYYSRDEAKTSTSIPSLIE